MGFMSAFFPLFILFILNLQVTHIVCLLLDLYISFLLFCSENITVKVNCHHSGQFITNAEGLQYADGVVEVFEVESNLIFQDVLMKMLDKGVNVIGRMWYKLPFEDLFDRRPLWENVDANKKKLVARARWMGEVDIFFEKAEATKEEDINVVGKEDTEADGSGDTKTDEKENLAEASSHANLSESSESESDGEIQIVEEENLEVFNNDNYEEQILDEDEVYPATDDSSGDEEEQAQRLVRRGVVDGVFSLRQLFSSATEFKQNVIKYVLKTRRNVVYDRWEHTKVSAKCTTTGCSWRIYCSVEHPIGKWMVKVYVNEHQCHPTGRCELIKSPVIADLFLEDIRRDPEMSAPEIKDEMKRRHNIIISPNQAKVARRRVFDKLQAECDEQFARLRDYELQLLE